MAMQRFPAGAITLPFLVGGMLGFLAVCALTKRSAVSAVPGWSRLKAASRRRNAPTDAGLSQV